MADGTPIEWTDATWNVITGCSVVSPGCTNCYAMKLAGTRLRHHPSREGLTIASKAGPVWNGETRVNWEWIDQPINWRRPRTIFVCAHGDLFHETVAQDDIAQIYGVMIAAHHLRGHILQVLTKRSARMRAVLNDPEFWEVANASASALILEHVDPLERLSGDARATCDDYGPDNPPPGIWVGVSVEDQPRADERIPDLLAAPAAVRWLSMEPLLGPVDLSEWLICPNARDGLSMDPSTGACECCAHCDWTGLIGGLGWIVAGGESGNRARGSTEQVEGNMRGLLAQCRAAGVPFFGKQNYKKLPLPDDLLVREMPDAR